MIAKISQSLLAGAARLISGVRVGWNDALPLDDKPRIYLANHGSHLDIAVIWSALPKSIRMQTRPIAAGDYWECSRLRSWLAKEVFNAVLVDRTRTTRSSNPIDVFAEVIESGSSIIIFPEGTRSLTGAISEFKSGLWHLAKRVPDVPLVPVYLKNLNRILPKGEILPIPLISWCDFGAPVYFDADEAKGDFLERMRGQLITLSKQHDET